MREALILALVMPYTAGDPTRDHRWLNCRLVDIQQQLVHQFHFDGAFTSAIIGDGVEPHARQ
jgi:hypothetical protein